MVDFTAPSDGSYRVTFTGINGYGSNLDSFSLTAIPEPTAWGLLAGLGARSGG